MNRKKNCCYQCRKRSETCHVTCDEYAEFVRERDAKYRVRKMIEQSAPEWSKYTTDKVKRNLMDKPKRFRCK